MNIGFFGDSYVDLIWHRYSTNKTIAPEKKIWAYLLLEEFNSPVICSGLGGSNQYHAIAEWRKFSIRTKFDVAIFTFTWAHRLYAHPLTEAVVTAHIEGRHLSETNEQTLAVKDALDKYYKYLYSSNERNFEFELMVRWCLDLPNQYPDTKFIFLPNTTHAQEVAKKYFTKGVLVDFAFEQLSLLEGEQVGVAPMISDRYGHLSSGTHVQVKDMVKDIIFNHNDCVFPVDYTQFNLKNLYPYYYDNK